MASVVASSDSRAYSSSPLVYFSGDGVSYPLIHGSSSVAPVDLTGSKNMMGALECNIPLIFDARIFIIQVLK